MEKKDSVSYLRDTPPTEFNFWGIPIKMIRDYARLLIGKEGTK